VGTVGGKFLLFHNVPLRGLMGKVFGKTPMISAKGIIQNG
jgi:hypothetical protein